MRYPAAETLEQSSLSVRRTLERIGVPSATFSRWYDHYQNRWPEPQPPLSQAAIRPKCVDDGRGRDLKNWMRRRNLRFRWLCRVIVVINAAPFSGLFCCSPQGGATRVGR
jgi:hypothetical protein